ncbi:hypothetical protein [Nocardiopsis flavescens]
MRKHVSVVMAAAAAALFALGTVPAAHAAPAAPPAPVDPALAAIPSGPLTFGAEALASAREAAAGAAAGASCAITADTATALALAPVWAEVVAGTMATPSPMTLSRYDTQPGLYDPAGREGLFFNPGVGLWQMDSAGLGSRNTAGEAIDSRWVSATVVPYIVGRYCTALNGGSAAPAARAAAWRDWNACADGDCDTAFWRAVNNGIGADPSVDRHGGAQPRTCAYGGATYDCLFVDVADAQGATWWAAPGGGRSPVPHPFYVLRTEAGGASQEVRVWLAQDSGHGVHVSVTRPFGADARTSLTWSDGDGLCDTTTGRGDC